MNLFNVSLRIADFLSLLCATGLRMSPASEQIIEQAVADKTIVCSWPMRGTIHFMPLEDARRMLKLLAQCQTIKFADASQSWIDFRHFCTSR